MDKIAKKSYSQKAYLGRYPYNLVNSGNLDEYYQTLSDFTFLAAKLNHPDFGIQALIEDYDLLDGIDYQPEKVEALKLIQGALRLSAHVLATDKQQLAGQLLGRLLGLNTPEIQAFLAEVKDSHSEFWLRPLTPSLTPPGGCLIRTLTGHSGRVTAVAVTPNGEQVISAGSNGTLKIWNLVTGQELHTVTGHRGSVTAVAVTPNSQQVISAGYDGTLKVWNLATGEVITTFTGDSSILCCAVAPDGLTIVAGEQSGRIHFLRLEGTWKI